MTLNKQLSILALFLAVGSQNTRAFVPASLPQAPKTVVHSDNAYYFADDRITSDEPSQSQQTAPPPTKRTPTVKKSPAKKHGSVGVFSPAVLVLKDSIGDQEINSLRTKMIKLHSEVIGGFVSTAESSFGRGVLKQLFQLADRNMDNRIEEDELRAVFSLLGFDWLKEKQVKGIFERADKDKNGWIDLDEWMAEAPKTLKTNLIKLAKKNGQEMGLLV